MTLLVEVRDRDVSNKSQRERNLPQKLKMTVLATSMSSEVHSLEIRDSFEDHEECFRADLASGDCGYNAFEGETFKLRLYKLKLSRSGVRKGFSQLILHGKSRRL